jgi:hypothetical protein
VTIRSDSIAIPPLKWLLIPFAGVALAATVVQTIRRRARHPTVRPMSDGWLREQDAARAH